MSAGIIVDGQAEPAAFRALFPKLVGLGARPKVLYAALQPMASPGQIARKAISRVRRLRDRKAHPVILLIDRENRRDCPPAFAAEVQKALERLGEAEVFVVVKNRALENWLIADPDGLARLRGRFRLTQAFHQRVSPNKADSIRDAASFLGRVCLGMPYHKRRDPPRVLRAIDVAAAARNSRSLRRFLRLVGDTRYAAQSKKP